MHGRLYIVSYINRCKFCAVAVRFLAHLGSLVSSIYKHRLVQHTIASVPTTQRWLNVELDWPSRRLAVMKIIHLVTFLAISGIVVGKTSARMKRSPDGERILIEQAPYFVSIRSQGGHECGGVLLYVDVVLTMPNCLIFGSLTVVTGVDENNPNGTVHEIKYTRSGNARKVAILYLVNPIELNDKQDTVNMPLEEPSYNETVEFISFRPEAGDRNTELRRFAVTMAPYHLCTTKIVMLCATRKLSSAMHNDEVGGPLIHNGRLVGIASNELSRNKDYDVYLDFYKFLKEFVRSIIRYRFQG